MYMSRYWSYNNTVSLHYFGIDKEVNTEILHLNMTSSTYIGPYFVTFFEYLN